MTTLSTVLIAVMVTESARSALKREHHLWEETRALVKTKSLREKVMLAEKNDYQIVPCQLALPFFQSLSYVPIGITSSWTARDDQ